MWEPGTAPPVSSGKASSSTSNKESKKQGAASSSSGLVVTGNIQISPKESKAIPKKLSGATMNMRFMKRKEESREQERERQRKRLSADSSSAPVTSSLLAIATTAPASPLSQPPCTAVAGPVNQNNHRRDHPEDAMEVDEDPVTNLKSNDLKFQMATPVDMYGIQASLIGRRSFGGFNAAMEEAWKESKASLDDDGDASDRPRKNKVTDEELIQRYQDIVKKRSESSRPVGNLRDKANTKRQRR